MVGEWGPFLERHCRTLLGADHALRLDLAGLSSVDTNGVRVLRRLRSPRVELLGCPPLILEMIEQGAA